MSLLLWLQNLPAGSPITPPTPVADPRIADVVLLTMSDQPEVLVGEVNYSDVINTILVG